jgi:maleate isomerase
MTRGFRIGRIVPSSNMTMETEIAGMLRGREAIRPERFTFRSSRLEGGMHRPAHAGSS